MNASYLPSLTLDEYLSTVATVHPQLGDALDFTRPGTAEALARLTETETEFDSDHNGRGDSYRRAQQDVLVRWTGIEQLLRLAVSGRGEAPLVLDVLGGDGTLARAAAGGMHALDAKLTIVTGDLSGPMIDRALAQGLPAVRQAARFLFLRDASLDAVLLAYGTHHIAPEHRPEAIAEAVRVTRPGGRIVIHDFDSDSPMAGFFGRVVHPHATGGHAYPHFSRAELATLFRDAGVPGRVFDLYDPLVMRAETERAARDRLCAYIGDMYGVSGYFATLGGADEVWRTLERLFDHSAYRSTVDAVPDRPVVYRADGQFVAEVPRIAIVAVATRPN